MPTAEQRQACEAFHSPQHIRGISIETHSEVSMTRGCSDFTLWQDLQPFRAEGETYGVGKGIHPETKSIERLPVMADHKERPEHCALCCPIQRPSPPAANLLKLLTYLPLVKEFEIRETALIFQSHTEAKILVRIKSSINIKVCQRDALMAPVDVSVLCQRQMVHFHHWLRACAPAAKPNTMATSLIRYDMDRQVSFFMHLAGMAFLMSCRLNGGASDSPLPV